MSKECYICGNDATSKEHVPPQCIFPERKDTPNNVDLRKNLITVPSCDTHNSVKSGDDEYFFHILTMIMGGNEIASNQFNSKIQRSNEKNPRLKREIEQDSAIMAVQSELKNKKPNAVLTWLNKDKFFNVLDHIGRALFYHTYNKKCFHKIIKTLEFVQYENEEDNQRIVDITKKFDRVSHSCDAIGCNPNVFHYKIMKDTEDNLFMRLSFYGDINIVLSFI
jgi:hypothetical protein